MFGWVIVSRLQGFKLHFHIYYLFLAANAYFRKIITWLNHHTRFVGTQSISCIARIYSGITPIDNEQWSSLSPWRKLKLGVKLKLNLIIKKLKEWFYLLTSLHNKVRDSKMKAMKSCGYPEQNKRIAQLSFFHGCRKRRLRINSTYTWDRLRSDDDELTPCHICSIFHS
jgi:hypothetical protein